MQRKQGKKSLILIFLMMVFVFDSYSQAAWLMQFEQGKQKFRSGEVPESLSLFRSAILSRRATFTSAEEKYKQVLLSKQAKKAEGSIERLIEIYAKEDIQTFEYEKIKKQANGSFKKRIELISERFISNNFQSFIDALKAVLETRSITEFSDSLGSLSAFISYAKDFSEAEYWIGLIFLEEGEYDFAEQQFIKAYEKRYSLDVEALRFDILFSLARVYEVKGKTKAAVDKLSEIVNSDSEFDINITGNERMKENIITMITGGKSTVIDKPGFEKLMTLFRLKAVFALDAYNELGKISYSTGSYKNALLYYTYAVNIITTQCIVEMESLDEGYTYSNLDSFLNEVAKNSLIQSYLLEKNYYESLYFLALSLCAQNSTSEGKYILTVLSTVDLAKPYKDKSLRQLQKIDITRP